MKFWLFNYDKDKLVTYTVYNVAGPSSKTHHICLICSGCPVMNHRPKFMQFSVQGTVDIFNF